MRCALLVVVLVLAACGSQATQEIAAQHVLDAFGDASLEVTNVSAAVAADDLPATYTEHLAFTITELGTMGGQVFVCEDKPKCDALHSYFAERSNPYLFQGADGRVLVKLDSSVPAVTAARFQAVVDHLDKRPADD